ncbi:MAG: DOMON-like domain-containing protein, partial [Thermosynechococcaceae cyanobacterium]
RYTLLGDLSEIQLPPWTPSPTRQSNLWETTCFEFFLGVRSAEPYWEFNLSPSGHWNVYRFTGYRQGMETETAITTLPFDIQTEADAVSLVLELDLTPILAKTSALEMGITTVVQSQDGTLSHWAIAHPGPKADFHDRKGFVLAL